MKLMIKLFTAIIIVLLMNYSAAAVAMSSEDCVSAMKEQLPNADHDFMSTLCECITTASGESEKVSEEVLKQCTSTLLVAKTITDFPGSKGPSNEGELIGQCKKSAKHAFGHSDGKDDKDLAEYCACIAKPIMQLKDGDVKEIQKKLIEIGQTCAKTMKMD